MPIFKKQDMNKQEGTAPGLEILQIVDQAQGTHALKMGEVTIAPNSRLARHIHPNTEEAIVVLEGNLVAMLGRERATISPGDTVLAPAGSTHGLVNPNDQPARVLFIFPTHNPETVQSRAEGTTKGFTSETGLSGYGSPQDRPLDGR
jgi:quercetin dioxygenase-like cupin family protein